jgi:hypothetical protein
MICCHLGPTKPGKAGEVDVSEISF